MTTIRVACTECESVSFLLLLLSTPLRLRSGQAHSALSTEYGKTQGQLTMGVLEFPNPQHQSSDFTKFGDRISS
ncbi:hypothetical protein IQ243_13730 [Nostocales cyanobacterium LEGE 11386]|nr:hypothetical protein [Nostocales cyanobacterium LEGE 11386]